ncbi:MAG: hypothetical protein ABFS32_22970 [Bacteroidota bacterium]
MLQKYIVLIIILLSAATNVYAQEKPDTGNQLDKNALSFSVFGTSGMYGLSYERIISRNSSIEIGVGLIGIGAGYKYYYSDLIKGKILIHSGFTMNTSPLYSDDCFSIMRGRGILVYLPIGMSYNGKKRLSLGLDIGPGTTFVRSYSGHYVIIYGNLKIGIRF